MRRSVFTALGCGLATVGSAAASCPADDARHFAERVTARIDGSLTYPDRSFRRNQTGIVEVGFVFDSEGKPASVVVERSSSWPSLDRAAVRAVVELGRVDGARPGQRMRAVLQFGIAAGAETRSRLDSELRRSASAPRLRAAERETSR